MRAVRQRFPASPPFDLERAVRDAFNSLKAGCNPDAKIAVAVGSRGITRMADIVKALLGRLREAGARPCILPAMGSHGGATSEGQKRILADYGITERDLDVPIHAGMDTRSLGTTGDGLELFFSSVAMEMDGIILVNRVKPHTDFAGSLGSGLLKMLVVGLGKREGAAQYHAASSRLGYEAALRSLGSGLLARTPVLGGLAIVEDPFHQPVRIEGARKDELPAREEELFKEAARLMPRLPFDDIDLLIVDRIGKNISGTGMDPNIIGRGVHGYSSLLKNEAGQRPFIRRIFVRDLTPETHGNAIGIGMADLTTTRLVKAIDHQALNVNALTSLTPQNAKIPIHFDTDREAIEAALRSLALPDPAKARVVRIADTLSLEHLQVSEALFNEMEALDEIHPTGEPLEMSFDSNGNLAPSLVNTAG
jgi:hypothetical protein